MSIVLLSVWLTVTISTDRGGPTLAPHVVSASRMSMFLCVMLICRVFQPRRYCNYHCCDATNSRLSRACYTALTKIDVQQVLDLVDCQPWRRTVSKQQRPQISTSPGIAQTTVEGLAVNWCHKSVEGRLAIGTVVNSTIVVDPTIRLPGFDLHRRQWSLLNRFWTGQGTL